MSYPANVTYPAPPYRLLGKWKGRRNDAEGKIAGQWKLGQDFNLPNQTYLALKLSPYSAATITAVDATAARKIPGVLLVLTSDDVKNDAVMSKIAVGNYKLLPFDQVRYAGQEVAAAVAEDPYVAQEAVEAINITYSKISYVNKIQDAMASGAPQVWPGTPNLQTPTSYTFGDGGVAAFKDSTLTQFAETYESNDCHNHPVTPMAGTVSANGGRPELYYDNQDCKSASRTVAGLVGLPYSRGWAKGTTTSGSFGGKSGGGYLQLATVMSQKIGRPVKFFMTKEHDIRNGARHPRDVFNVSAAVKSDGTIMGLKADVYNNTGASKSAGVGTASGAAAHFYNTYKVPNWTVNAYEVWTNYTSPGAYRNPPGPHADFAMGVFFDKIAGKLGMNPVTMMLKNNMYVVGDKNQLNNLPFYSIGQPDVLNQALSLSGFMTKWKAAPTSTSGLKGVVHGIGIANATSGLGSTASSNSTVVVLLSDGSLSVSSGGTDIGEGRTEQERLYAAEMMGLPMDYVTINNNDSEFIGDTGVTAGSMQTKNSGNCIVLACADAKNQMMAKAATALNTTVDKLTYAMDGSMQIYLTADKTQFRTFAQCAGQPTVIGVGKFVGPTGVTGNVFDTAVAEVDVDTDTGLVTLTSLIQVQDVGRVIHKDALDGQMLAAMIQAQGQTIQEEHWVDSPTGSLLGASHLDVKIPLFTQIPAMQVGYVEDAEQPPLSYGFGAKGMAEPPFGAPEPAIANAVANAIGWWPTTMPITPDKVLKALGKA